MAKIGDVMAAIAKRQLGERPAEAEAAQKRAKAREDEELAKRPPDPFGDDPRCLERPPAGPYAIRPGILSCVVPDGHECDGMSHRMPRWSTVNAVYIWSTYKLCPTYSEEKAAERKKPDEIVEVQKARSGWRPK